MVEMKAEIDLRSQTIPWIELARRKLRFQSAESGRGCEDLRSEQDVGFINRSEAFRDQNFLTRSYEKGLA